MTEWERANGERNPSIKEVLDGLIKEDGNEKSYLELYSVFDRQED